MKLFTRLEKNKAVWFLLAITLLFFLLRLPSLIEPNWYGDEGIYQVIGLALHKGRMLYSQIWDNKPPLLYIVYAILHGDQFGVRLFALITGLFTTGLFFQLSQLLFKQIKASLISTLLFTFLFATPFWEGNIANAENFMLLPIIGAGILIYKYSSLPDRHQLRRRNLTVDKKSFAIHAAAGIMLGVAFLFKIIAIFDFAAFLIFLTIISLPDEFKLRRVQKINAHSFKKFIGFAHDNIIPFLVGFLIPIIITSLYFMLKNAFKDFVQAVFFSNVGYVGYGNKLLIPQGLLILKLALLACIVGFIFWKRKNINKSTTFTILWLAFSLFNAYFSGRPYTHYALVTLPSICLLFGLFMSTNQKRERYIFLLIFFFSIILLNKTFKFNLNRTFAYYGNNLSFLMGQKNVNSYQSFFDKKTPRDYEIASFIKSHSRTQDDVFIWGNSAQIYALSNKIPPGKYTVAYHITQYKSGFIDTQNDINKVKPKYIIALSDTQHIPFYLPAYVSRFVFEQAMIYERSN